MEETGGTDLGIAPFWHGFFLQFDVGVQIHLRGVHGFMSEPHRDYRTVHAMLQEIHRSVMAQNVWGHTFVFQ